MLILLFLILTFMLNHNKWTFFQLLTRIHVLHMQYNVRCRLHIISSFEVFFTLSILSIKPAMSLPFRSNAPNHSHTEWVLEKIQQYCKFSTIVLFLLSVCSSIFGINAEKPFFAAVVWGLKIFVFFHMFWIMFSLMHHFGKLSVFSICFGFFVQSCAHFGKFSVFFYLFWIFFSTAIHFGNLSVFIVPGIVFSFPNVLECQSCALFWKNFSFFYLFQIFCSVLCTVQKIFHFFSM